MILERPAQGALFLAFRPRDLLRRREGYFVIDFGHVAMFAARGMHLGPSLFFAAPALSRLGGLCFTRQAADGVALLANVANVANVAKLIFTIIARTLYVRVPRARAALIHVERRLYIMSAIITPIGSTLQVKTKVGTLSSGADKIRSISFSGIDESANGQLLLDVSAAIAGVIDAPVIKNERVDRKLITAE